MGVSGDNMRKMVNTNQLNLSDGEIHLFDFRMGMLPIQTLTSLFENIYERIGEEAFEVLFQAGKTHGQMAIDDIGKAHGVPKKQFIEQTIYTADALGLGEFKLERIDLEEQVIAYRIDNSPFKEQFEKSEALRDLDRPIDELQRGMFHRVSQRVLNADTVETRETHCRFQGDAYCRFVSKGKQ
ncbi:hypothetical protein [Candidatus Nanohalococcus occultus]|uniref:4-vinyl reductase 4VR domain-containing protein n=1 Tax=Candidatus Nanohalococcus occultus TaxID=2978047 RepID=A0ABY8CH19_9ARCH|nr:hypothetical protein SVXNc_0293 [Candidatus Nanohaloarchaeota archaeon SVXNc]